jgi:hypothetical protein
MPAYPVAGSAREHRDLHGKRNHEAGPNRRRRLTGATLPRCDQRPGTRRTGAARSGSFPRTRLPIYLPTDADTCAQARTLPDSGPAAGAGSTSTDCRWHGNGRRGFSDSPADRRRSSLIPEWCWSFRLARMCSSATSEPEPRISPLLIRSRTEPSGIQSTRPASSRSVGSPTRSAPCET